MLRSEPVTFSHVVILISHSVAKEMPKAAGSVRATLPSPPSKLNVSQFMLLLTEEYRQKLREYLATGAGGVGAAV